VGRPGRKPARDRYRYKGENEAVAGRRGDAAGEVSQREAEMKKYNKVHNRGREQPHAARFVIHSMREVMPNEAQVLRSGRQRGVRPDRLPREPWSGISAEKRRRL